MEIGNTTAIVHSYAKVNLTLDVLGVRPDGYHAIESVMQSVSLHDTLALTLRDEPGIRIVCDMPGIPTDEKNLAHKAASILFRRLGINPGLEIRIEKRIPVEAGLGGGSSNAAAVLRAFGSKSSKFGVQSSKLLGSGTLNIEPGTLNSVAAEVGSDVPFFLVGGSALVTGRGEQVEALPDAPCWWVLIVKPPFGVSTPWAYKRLDEMGERPSLGAGELITASERMTRCVRASDWACLPDLLSNDLELPAIEQHPEIGVLKDGLLRAGAQGALMCGSGSAVFGLFPNEDAARYAANAFAGDGLQVFVCPTVTRQEATGIE